VIAVDQRGHGKSSVPWVEGEYLIPKFASDIFEILKALDVRKCCLIGHSLGGSIALQFTLDHQEMLAALVLVDTCSYPIRIFDPDYIQYRKKLDEIAISQGMEAAFEYELANNPERKERFHNHPELRSVAKQNMSTVPVASFINIPRAVRHWIPLTPRLNEIKIPTLILWGDEDKDFAEAARVLKENIPDCQFVVFPGVGHSPQEEAPERFNSEVLNFLSNIVWC
jgi:pimeloyl-ACP methyl ester carboxylesterase